MIKINILFVAPNVCMDCNTGDVIHVTELASNMKKLGNEVTVLARLKNSNRMKFSFTFRNVKFIHHKIFWIPTVMFSAFLTGFHILLTNKIDIIYERHHVFGVGVLLGKIFKIPVIIEVNGLTNEEMSAMYSFNKFLIKIVCLIEEFVFNRAEKIITVTNQISKYIHTKYHIPLNKITSITNGVNIDIFKPIPNSREILNLDENSSYICFVGTLAPWQGVEYLIQSAPSITNEILSTKFLIIGDGLMKNESIELAKKTGIYDRFIFTGTVPHNKVPLYINSSDVCIVYKKPLKSGYSPLKLYEYMACGKPVVASKVEGFEILEKEKAGILVDPENPVKLAKTIIYLLKEKKLRDEMGLNGINYVVNNHSWYNVAKRVVKICNEIKYPEKDII